MPFCDVLRCTHILITWQAKKEGKSLAPTWEAKAFTGVWAIRVCWSLPCLDQVTLARIIMQPKTSTLDRNQGVLQ